MQVIPAIDLLEGKCVRLYQGDYQQAEVHHEDPVRVALDWVEQGATRLHLVDLDGAKQGKVVNLAAIAAIVKAVPVPIQVGGGLREKSSFDQLFDLGVTQGIVGTVAVENPDLVQQWCQDFPSKILLGIDARGGKVAIKGWLETSSIEAIDLAQQFQTSVAGIIYTDIHRDGTLTGPNLVALRELAAAVSLPIIASGGVSSLTDILSLLALESQGVTGVIVGKALYTKALDLREAIQAVGPGRWQDVLPGGFSTFA